MFRRGDKWWVRELERRERAFAAERAELVKTICHLAGNPLPADPGPAPPPRPVEQAGLLLEDA